MEIQYIVKRANEKGIKNSETEEDRYQTRKTRVQHIPIHLNFGYGVLEEDTWGRKQGNIQGIQRYKEDWKKTHAVHFEGRNGRKYVFHAISMLMWLWIFNENTIKMLMNIKMRCARQIFSCTYKVIVFWKLSEILFANKPLFIPHSIVIKLHKKAGDCNALIWDELLWCWKNARFRSEKSNKTKFDVRVNTCAVQ